MFCPKCGIQNPETGKFCRSCGTDLGNVSKALSGKFPVSAGLCDRKGKPITMDGAIMKLFSGLAFVVVAIALAVTGAGRGWWFWLLIPAFMSIGAAVAQYFQLRQADPSMRPAFASPQQDSLEGGQNAELPPMSTQYAAPESRFKTGDLVPPSVTDTTTRRLEMDPEGKTMTLPKV